MPDLKSKTEWERENVIHVQLKINKNQDPELFHLLRDASTRSSILRELLRKAVK